MKNKKYLILSVISACLVLLGCRNVSPTEDELSNIDDSDAMISINTPRYGETYEPGSVLSIKWDSTPSVSRVNIEIYRKTELTQVLASKIPNSGTFDWKIPSTFTQSHHYKIKVVYTYNSQIFSLSGVFNIISE